MKKTIISASEAETEALAARVANAISNGAVIALHGDLGAGKTVFARGFARALGIAEPITSPTFTIVQEYNYSGGRFYHLDLYRIDNADAALAFGVDEFLYGHRGATLLEWSERITPILPPSTIHITIERAELEDARCILLPEGFLE